MKTKQVIATVIVMALCASCSHKEEQANEGAKKATQQQGTSQNDGATITLSTEQAQRFETVTVQIAQFTETLRASARTIAAAIPELETSRPLVIFETQDISQMFSDYTKNKAGYERSSTQLARIKELQTNNAASGKDALDAQTDKNQNEASLRESESKLLQIGLNPQKLGALPVGAVMMMCDVPEAKIGGVSMGEETEFEFNAFPNERFRGRVTSIGNTIDPQTRTVKVGIELPNTKNKIKPGMFAYVRIQEREIQAISVPHDAVVSADAKTFVFVKKDATTFERRAVTIGADNGTEFQIIAGLETGDKVVKVNAILLKGMSFGY